MMLCSLGKIYFSLEGMCVHTLLPIGFVLRSVKIHCIEMCVCTLLKANSMVGRVGACALKGKKTAFMQEVDYGSVASVFSCVNPDDLLTRMMLISLLCIKIFDSLWCHHLLLPCFYDSVLSSKKTNLVLNWATLVIVMICCTPTL